MRRRHLLFACEGARLAGTLDEAPGTTGLLIVSGGNETRAGAFSGQARLAARIAAAGFPVFRFDRRGVGDSEGDNTGFRDSAADIAAALTAFRAEAAGLERVTGFGNCDAASALMLNRGAGLDGLVLANPWTLENEDAPLPPPALRRRYAARLRNPGAWLRLASGRIAPGRLVAGIRHALRPLPPPGPLAQAMAAGLKDFAGPVTILLAERDRAAQFFEAVWDRDDPRIHRCPDATHGFAGPQAGEWLFRQVIEALRRG